MAIITINDINDPRVGAFGSLTEAQLRNRLDPSRGIFIAESPKVIDIALQRGMEPISLLMERKHINGDASAIIDRCGDIPVYTGDRQLLSSITGYTLTRGVLCAMRRPEPPNVETVCRDAKRVALIHSVTDTTNIGAIFRSAAALNIDAVLLTRDSCDPLNRRSIRVSMGTVFLIPWAWIDDPQTTLNNLGFKTVAMALTDASLPIDDERLARQSRLAIILGTEGDGLPKETIAKADFTARIPMARNVDSLNVAAAAAIAFWQLKL